ncbi:MAG: hypothetical protein AWT59_0195 [Candidatus Gallionella acididurans]|uniref:Uncharacterized protein n=1 Tax=Candidatus Gallionella acididurans TaxID=1796491 RepID=A0A139BXA6_9PROT|nr:MAG: hypothetical protein AWT59_0195 [Candidatus Gallionella acididurans]
MECGDMSPLLNAQTCLMQLLAIPLINPETIDKWLVMRTPKLVPQSKQADIAVGSRVESKRRGLRRGA